MKRLLLSLLGLLLPAIACADGGMGPGPGISITNYTPTAFVQGNSDISFNTCAYSSAQTAGNLNVFSIGWNQAGFSVSSVTDTLGNTYAAAAAATGTGNAKQQIYYAAGILGGTNTIAVAWTGGTMPTGLDIRCGEWSGVSSTSPLDQQTAAAGTGTALNSGNITTTQSADLLVGSNYVANNVIPPLGAGYTQRIYSGGSNNVQDQSVTFTGTYNETASQSASGFWIASIAAFKASSGAFPMTGYYVAPSGGSDSNPGTLAQPFATLAHAQTAMQGSGVKTTYLRAGTYSSTALTLTSADSGENWTYYTGDGYDSAILDGGASSPTTGANPFNIDGASSVTVNGLTLQNCKNWCIGIHGGEPDTTGGWSTNVSLTNGNSITNNIITTGYTSLNNNWAGGGIWVDGGNTNLTISHNVIEHQRGSGIRVVKTAGSQDATNLTYTFTGLTVQSNFIEDTNSSTGDNGTIYMEDFNNLSTAISITNNFIRDYQENKSSQTNTTTLYRGVAIYEDSGTSNATISGNVIASTLNTNTIVTFGGTNAWYNAGGQNNAFTGNIIDMGAQPYYAPVAYDDQLSSATGNSIGHNIIIGNWTGSQTSSFFGTGPSSYFYNANFSPTTHFPTNTTNLYFNYGGGTILSTSNQAHGGDASPTTGTDPLFAAGQRVYTLSGGSPAFSAPVSFPAITGGWGPPGYTIPSGTAPSYGIGTPLLTYLTGLEGTGGFVNGQHLSIFGSPAGGTYGTLLNELLPSSGATPANVTFGNCASSSSTSSCTSGITDTGQSPAIVGDWPAYNGACGLNMTRAQSLAADEAFLDAGAIVMLSQTQASPVANPGAPTCAYNSQGGEFPGVLMVGGSCSGATTPATCNTYFWGYGANSSSPTGGLWDLANFLKTLAAHNPRKVLVRLLLEANGGNSAHWWGTNGTSGTNPSNAQFVTLFQQSVNFLNSQGVTNALYMYTTNWFSAGPSADDPGSSYWQVGGIDMYCCTNTSGVQSAMTAEANWPYMNGTGKPFILAETGNNNAGGAAGFTYDVSIFNNAMQGYTNGSHLVGSVIFCCGWQPLTQLNASGYVSGTISRAGLPVLQLRPARVTHLHDWRAKRQRPLMPLRGDALRDAA